MRVDGLQIVHPADIHCTIKFLGDISRTQVESIISEASQVVAAHHMFTIALNGVGVFPNHGVARTLWVGVGGDLRPLLGLHKDIETFLEGLGFAREKRRFHPHLTVARVVGSMLSLNRRRVVEALLSAEFHRAFCIDVEAVSLMCSRILLQESRYECLADMPLAGVIDRKISARHC